jgi:hypothetical protein
MKHALVASTLLFSGTALANTADTRYDLDFGYMFNNQIEHGAFFGGVLGREVELCHVPRLTTFTYRDCETVNSVGVVGEALISQKGFGFNAGLVFDVLQFKYGRFYSDSPYWPSSDRYFVSLAVSFFRFEVGVKKEDGEDTLRPSLGFGVGI